MSGKSDIFSKLDEIKEIVEQNEQLENKVSLFEQVLANNSLFCILFNGAQEVIFQNIPSTIHGKQLKDFSLLLGKDNLLKVQERIATKENQPSNLNFQWEGANFELQALPPDHWSIQINPIEANVQNQSSEQARLDEIAGDFEQFQKLAESLEDIRKLTLKNSYDQISEKIQDIHLPQISRLKEKIDDPVLRMCLDIIEQTVSEVSKPEMGINEEVYSYLTPSEVQIAKFIRMGKTTKEIANILSIAGKTVENHRNNLRTKLGITNKGVNLQTYLSRIKELPE